MRSIVELYLNPSTSWPLIAAAIIIVTLLHSSFAACLPIGTGQTVVVYTSLDQPFSEPIMEDFKQLTGINVNAVYDVEAAKTTGLVNRLIAERNRPRADVFWSSEYAQTLILKSQGILAPYQSPSASDIPQQYRDMGYYWTGFAARARVIIVNTKLVPAVFYPKTIFDLLDAYWGPGEVGIANPLSGTTATHAAALFVSPGPDKAKAFFEGLLARNVRVVAGNSVVRDMVVSGELKVGLTDTDDAYIAIAKGDPVELIFPDQTGLGTLLIPNTISLINGAPNLQAAKRFIDFVLSREVEAKLARYASGQMPVREDVNVPAGFRQINSILWMKVRMTDVAGQMPASSAWLKEVFLR